MHETEMCADEVGCSNPVHCRGLCTSHYRKQARKNTLPPKFTRYPHGQHVLGDTRADGCRFCGACRDYVRVWRIPHQPYDRCTTVQLERALNLLGWSLLDWDNAVVSQGGACAICHAKPTNGPGSELVADHNHLTGQRREVLCHACNMILGFARDDRNVLHRAIDYLDNHTTV